LGGILREAKAQSKLQAEAGLVQLYTGPNYRSPALKPKTVRALRRLTR